MLDSLRKYATSWVAQILMGVLVLSFAVWGVNDVFNGFGSNDVAKVGSTSITVADFQRDYQLAVQNLSRQLGKALTPDQARQAGVPSQILGRLVNQATLDDAAGNMRLGISNEALGKKIAADPQFFGNTGTFDRGYLTQVIRSQGLSEDTFILNRRREYLRGQLAQGFAGGIVSPTAYLRAIHEYRSEARDVSYLILAAPPASEIGEPSETDLATFFDTQKATWNTPEVRSANYFTLSPDAVSRADDISDEDAKKRYDEQAARFSTPEKRQLQQIVFKDRAEADQAATALAGGKTFDVLVTERNLKPADVDLGIVTKDKIADPVIADAAFALAANTTSAVVEGQFGPAILRVTTIEPAVVTSFEQAKADIKKELADARAVAEITDTRNAIEDARAAGDTFAEIASKYGLKVVPVTSINADGKDLEDKAVPDLPTGLVRAIFESDVGNENDPLQPDGSTFVWYEVTAVTAPRERPLAEVRDKVAAAWKDAERVKRLATNAETIKSRLDGKEDIATVATSLNVEVKKATAVTRLTKAEGDLTVGALSALFDAQKGQAVVADGTEPMTRLVLLTDNVTVPEFSETAPDLVKDRPAFDGQFINTFLGLYVTDLQSKTNVKFNQLALQQVLGVSDSAN